MSALTPQSDMPTPTTDKITQAAMETIYLCKFRVSMDGEWLCLRELDDISLTPDPEPTHEGMVQFSTLGALQPSHCYNYRLWGGEGEREEGLHHSRAYIIWKNMTKIVYGLAKIVFIFI